MPRTPEDRAFESWSLKERRSRPGGWWGREYEVPNAENERQRSTAEGRLTPSLRPRSRERSEMQQNLQSEALEQRKFGGGGS
ncbi:hypothetical protein NDU88_002962 [Pleurodeles waltl]|uniref:Uncharacterized protein n=1 Tax=Pleurodeles waltl TaxID=8319 RepID=A0AAV7NGW9_PLEWA|nr:hypothetical protein NDU88_002962 [Pleurodeles waltl]